MDEHKHAGPSSWPDRWVERWRTMAENADPANCPCQTMALLHRVLDEKEEERMSWFDYLLWFTSMLAWAHLARRVSARECRNHNKDFVDDERMRRLGSTVGGAPLWQCRRCKDVLRGEVVK
mgnify:CR=1 FL=1